MTMNRQQQKSPCRKSGMETYFLRQEGNTERMPDEPSPIGDSYHYQNEKRFKTIKSIVRDCIDRQISCLQLFGFDQLRARNAWK